MKMIYAIETTSRCNNACPYCPHTKFVRGKRDQDMDDATWKRCLYWLDKLGQKTVVHLMLFGEPLLDAKLFDRLKDLKEMGIPTSLSTNGRLFTSEVAHKLKEAGVENLSISPHTPDAEAIIGDIIHESTFKVEPFYSKKYPAKIYVSNGFINAPHNWAGQVNRPPAKYFYDCHFVHEEKCCILADGRITACCIDAAGVTTMGNVFETDLISLEPQKFPLCDECHHLC